MEELKNDSSKNDPLKNIKSEYMLKKVFNYLDLIKLLNLIKKSKLYQNKLNKDINSYKDEYSKIEIEIIPAQSDLIPFINDNIKDVNYHFYINDKKEEFKRNYLLRMDNAKKIKVIIDKNKKSLKGLFQNCVYNKKITFTKFNRNDIEDMSFMFNECQSLKKLIFNFNTSNVFDMSYMFSECNLLKELNLSNFKTDKVNSMSFMFNGCFCLEKLNLLNFCTKGVLSMKYMFNECSSLKELDLSNFLTDNVVDMIAMFQSCSSLIELNISNFTINADNNINYMFNECKSLEKLICLNNNILKEYNKNK